MNQLTLFLDLSCVSKNRFINLDRSKEREEYKKKRKVEGGKRAWGTTVKNILANKK